MNPLEQLIIGAGNLLRTLPERTRAAQKKLDLPIPEWQSRHAEVEKFNIPDGAIYRNQASLYQRLSWLQIAVSAVARAAAVDRLAVKEMVGEKTKEIVNHDFEKLLIEPNELMSRFEFLESTFSYLALNGNGYWWLNKANEKATPDEMWIIPPHQIQPVPDKKLYIEGYAYDPGDGRPIPMETWEIVHFKKFHPLNAFVGLSVVEALALISIGDLSMQKYNAQFFGENNARLPGILAFSDFIQDPEWEKIKQDTIDRSAKRQLMMLRGAGKGGVEWMQAAVSQKEMEFLKGREFNQKEIYDAVAPGLFGMLSENSTEANAIIAEGTFNKVGLWPILDGAGQKITNDVMPLYGDNLVAEFDDVRITDREMELSEQQAYSRVHTIDEIREKFYDDMPIGDERGDLLPTQVGQSAVLEPGIEDNANPEPAEQPREQIGDSFDAEEEEDLAQKVAMSPAARADLAKWERKALRRLKEGKLAACDFTSVHMSLLEKATVSERLELATTLDAVKAAFVDITPSNVPGTIELTADNTDITDLTDALLGASKALRETVPVEVIPLPPQTLNVTVTPSTAEVDVSQPEITVNVPPAEPPIVNVNNEINVPEQPPAEVTVNIPEPKPRKTTVKRDTDDNITELVTE